MDGQAYRKEIRMRYKIEFELPDNDTVLKEIKHASVGWQIWGYSGIAKPVPSIDAVQYTNDEIQRMQDIEQAQIQKAYDIGKADAKQQWIPVEERLPEKENKSYWICTDGGYQCQCRWTNDKYGLGAYEWSEWAWSIFDIPQYSKVIAWMPLPQPYERKEE